MTPESTVKENDIRQICKLHDINYVSHGRIAVGFNNEIYLINNELILKVYRHNHTGYETELAVLEEYSGKKMPKVIAHSSDRSVISNDYIVIEYIKGTPLGHIWHEANDVQRESLVSEVSEILRDINKMDVAKLPKVKGDSWTDILTIQVNNYADKLVEKNIVDAKKASRVKKSFASYEDILETKELYAVNWDIHFDNIIVDKDYKLQALIDLEYVKVASLDFPLAGLKSLMQEPERYMSLENEQFAKVDDYSKLTLWYKKYYPEMFNFENIEKRVEAYGMLHNLRLMQNWSHDKGAVARFNMQLKLAEENMNA